MSNDADLEYGPTPAGAAYEHTDIEPGMAYNFAIWLGVAMMLSAGDRLRHLLVPRGPRGVDRRGDAAAIPLAVGQSQEPPAPRLQTQPFRDVYQLPKSDQRGTLNSYGWVDKATAWSTSRSNGRWRSRSSAVPVRDGDAGAPTSWCPGFVGRPHRGAALTPRQTVDHEAIDAPTRRRRRFAGRAPGRAWCRRRRSRTRRACRPEPATAREPDAGPLQKSLRSETRRTAAARRHVPRRGRARGALGDYFGTRPVVLAFVYYECPMLCTQILNGLVSGLGVLDQTVGQEFDVVAISFDARETPVMAAAKKAVYLDTYKRPAPSGAGTS